MQSILQYRKIRLQVRKQLEKDLEKSGIYFTESHHPANPQPTQNPSISSSSSSTTSSENTNENTPNLQTIPTTRTAPNQPTGEEDLGHTLTGIHVRDRTTHEGKGEKVFIVDWEGPHDPQNPRNWSVAYRLWVTIIVASIAFIVGAASSCDTAILPQAAEDFGVSDVVESMSIGLYLIGFAVGASFAGPFSETFGRNLVYITTLILFMIFLMASALAPNIDAQLAFRFLAGIFGSTPLTCAGGSISDMWNPIEKTFAFPIFAIAGFGGPVLGPVIGSYIINLGSWRWAEWIILILAGGVLGVIVLFQPETFPPLLLRWKASHLRQETGNNKFKSAMEIVQKPLGARLSEALIRPITFASEPIVLAMALYLTILYIILFTFLDGYTYIFEQVYGISQGLTNVIFAGIFVGVLLAGAFVPWMYGKTKRSHEKGSFVPEERLWFAMLGAPAIPISLFWMGWTSYSSISIWSPILASVLLGYGLICIFMTAYMYIIDSYEVYAASALTFLTITRYLIAGGMTIAGVPFYKNVSHHWVLTILGCVSILMTPIPYVFFKYGHIVRGRSKFAVSY